MNNMKIFDERLQNAGTVFGRARQMSYTTEISVSKSWDHKSISQSLSKSGSNGGISGKTEMPHELEWRMKRDAELKEYEARKNRLGENRTEIRAEIRTENKTEVKSVNELPIQAFEELQADDTSSDDTFYDVSDE